MLAISGHLNNIRYLPAPISVRINMHLRGGGANQVLSCSSHWRQNWHNHHFCLDTECNESSLDLLLSTGAFQGLVRPLSWWLNQIQREEAYVGTFRLQGSSSMFLAVESSSGQQWPVWSGSGLWLLNSL